MELVPVIYQRLHLSPLPSWGVHPCPLVRVASLFELFLQEPMWGPFHTQNQLCQEKLKIFTFSIINHSRTKIDLEMNLLN